MGMNQSFGTYVTYRVGHKCMHTDMLELPHKLFLDGHVNTSDNNYYAGQLNGEVLCSIPAKRKATPNYCHR